MLRVLPLLCLSLCLQAEIVDRLAITVGKQVITELQLDEEIRVTAFLNHQSLSRDPETRRAAADRLIAQLLIQAEIQLSRYPSPTPEDIDQYFEQIRTQFGSAQLLKAALGKYDLTESTLRAHLALQLTTLRFIEYRFRPDRGSSGSDGQVDEALDAWLKESRRRVEIVYRDKSLE